MIKQFEFDTVGDGECLVTACLPEKTENTPIPAVVVCPGGGYTVVAEREGAPVAKVYANAGFATFVLRYSVQEKARDFRPLIQLASTVAYIRRHHQQWNIHPEKIAVCGFSAGGHLAASLGVLFNDETFLKVCPDLGNIRPNALILGYPCILTEESAGTDAIRGCIQNISGNAPVGSPEYDYFSLDRHVDEQTPPTFLWHTAEDVIVPVVHSIRFATALYYAGVPVEMHILPDGYHGMSICTLEVGTPHPYCSRWTQWSIDWLNRTFENA